MSRRRQRWRDPLRTAVEAVRDSERCTGCGVCVHIDDRISMNDVGGFRRPVVEDRAAVGSTRAAARRFRGVCPGIAVRAQRPEGSRRDPVLGPLAGLWGANATDEETRDLGSSGGALTALATWTVEREGVPACVAAGPSPDEPRRTVPVRITTRDEALAAAGSRYAPVSVGEVAEAVDPDAAVVCKPCEATALRALARKAGREPPLLLTFFCAGTPNQGATDALVERLGFPRPVPVAEVRYRGLGWPGSFRVRSRSGDVAEMDYETSWGTHLGPHVQWRCRTCPDGVGESGDVSVGDLWVRGPDGGPSFAERPGRSVLIARTRRGRRLVDAAVAGGVLATVPASVDDVVAVQPYQEARRLLLLPRLAATLALRGYVTRVRGFGILRSALRRPRASWSELRGAAARLRYRDRVGIRS